MSLPVFPRPVAPKRNGRPPLSSDPDARRKLVDVARARIVNRLSAARLAEVYGVTPLTIKRWTRAALALPGPEGDAVRRLAAAAP